MSEDEPTPDDGPSPLARRRTPYVTGTPVTMADGRDWLLASFVPALTSIWDKLYDSAVMEGTYEYEDMCLAAWKLLQANYDVTHDEAVALIEGADAHQLGAAINAALMDQGEDIPAFGWTHWVKVNLWVNGINPAHVPPQDLHIILQGLDAARKLIPTKDLIASTRYKESRRL